MTLPADARLRPLAVKQTMPVRDRSDMMWNFVALADENPWLANLDISAANKTLADRRAKFEEMLKKDGGKSYFALSTAEKEAVYYGGRLRGLAVPNG